MFVNHGLIIDYNIEIQDYVFERFGSTYGIRSHQNIIHQNGREYIIKSMKLLPRIVNYRSDRGLDYYRVKNIEIEFIRMCKYCGMDVETNDMFMTASTYNLNPNQTPLQNLFITEQIFSEEIIREKRTFKLNFEWWGNNTNDVYWHLYWHFMYLMMFIPTIFVNRVIFY